MAIDKALNLSVSLEKIWTEGDLKQKLQNFVFPSGLGYDKSNDRVRTQKVNAIFGSIPIFKERNIKHKKWRTDSCESILRFSDLGRIQTCNLLSRNQVHYSVMLRGLKRGANITH